MTPDTQSPRSEFKVLHADQLILQKKLMETRGMLDALCQTLIDAGVVSEQRLLAEAHGWSFVAVRRAHPCCWNSSLWCVLRSSDVTFNLVSFFVKKKDCVGLRTASRAFFTCMAEVSSALARPKVLVWPGDENGLEVVDIFDPVTETWDTFPSAHEYG